MRLGQNNATINTHLNIVPQIEYIADRERTRNMSYEHKAAGFMPIMEEERNKNDLLTFDDIVNSPLLDYTEFRVHENDNQAKKTKVKTAKLLEVPGMLKLDNVKLVNHKQTKMEPLQLLEELQLLLLHLNKANLFQDEWL